MSSSSSPTLDEKTRLLRDCIRKYCSSELIGELDRATQDPAHHKLFVEGMFSMFGMLGVNGVQQY